jgi:competence protein ComEC
VHPQLRPYHVALAAVVAGLLLAAASPVIVVLAAGVAVCVLAGCRAHSLAPVAGLLVIAGASLGHARLAAIDAPARALHPGDRLEAHAWLSERPRASRFGSSAELQIASGAAKGAHVLARAPVRFRWPGGGTPGTSLKVAGLLERPHDSAGATFDYSAYLRRRGIAYELRLERLEPDGQPRSDIAGAIDSLRRRAETGVGAGLSSSNADLANGMILGEDQAISQQTLDDFRRSGLAHLLAVSGQNVMLLGALALPLLSLAGLGVRGRLVAVGALVAIYVPLAGAGPSLQRAGVMGGAGLAAALAGRPASRSYAVLLAAAATLALNPRVAGEPGWQLSFAAVIGIALLVPPLRHTLSRALPGWLAEGIAVTSAAALATAPLLAHLFGSVQLVALPANLMALPVVAPIMWLGMIQAALGALGGPALVSAGWLGSLDGPLLAYLRWIARWFGDAPHGQATIGLRSPLSVAMAYVALASIAVALRTIARSVESRAPAWAAAWRRLPRRRRVATATAVVAVLALTGWHFTAPPGPPHQLTISFLDVGQGDATLIQDPSGAAVLFDGGPPEARTARLIRNLGVKRLSVVVATHQSRDHQGGLHEVVRRFPVALFLDGGDGTKDPDFRRLEAEVDARGIRREQARAGEMVRSGALTIQVLAPESRPPAPSPGGPSAPSLGEPRSSGDPNERAVVAIVSEGSFRLFLSADAESPSLLPLQLPPVTAMKVPHHGSADPGLPQVLERLRPQIAAIEVGAHNLYGHPRQSTLNTLARAVPHVYRTDRDGTIRLTVSDGRVKVSTDR